MEMQRRATVKTLDYIEEKMDTAEYFDTHYLLLDFFCDSLVDEDGLILEFGVWKGASINRIALMKSKKTIYGFDSFKGLPEDWRIDVKKDAFKLNALPKTFPNVKLIEGLFEDTLPDFLNEHGEHAAFIHIDSDLYSSAAVILKSLRDRIVPATIIVFDEYFNFIDWQNGEYKAFREFSELNNVKYKYIGYSNQSVAIKIVGHSVSQDHIIN